MCSVVTVRENKCGFWVKKAIRHVPETTYIVTFLLYSLEAPVRVQEFCWSMLFNLLL